MPTFHHLIAGELVAGQRSFAVIDPATGSPSGTAPDAPGEELYRARAGAEEASGGPGPREEALRRGARGAMRDARAAQAEPLGGLVSQEQGKPLQHAQNEVRGAARLLRLCA